VSTFLGAKPSAPTKVPPDRRDPPTPALHTEFCLCALVVGQRESQEAARYRARVAPSLGSVTCRNIVVRFIKIVLPNLDFFSSSNGSTALFRRFRARWRRNRRNESTQRH
jgi:hypothetical protein